MTKISLKQLRTNENILNQRQEERGYEGNSGGDSVPSGPTIRIEEEVIQRPNYLEYQRTVNSNSNNLGSTSHTKQSMFQTP